MPLHTKSLEFSFATAHRTAGRHHLLSCYGAQHVNLHHYAEVINGREYNIEVSSVDAGQWRAQIRRTPGGSAALMPFYGRTPDEAAALLSRWLSLAHGQVTPRL